MGGHRLPRMQDVATRLRRRPGDLDATFLAILRAPKNVRKKDATPGSRWDEEGDPGQGRDRRLRRERRRGLRPWSALRMAISRLIWRIC